MFRYPFVLKCFFLIIIYLCVCFSATQVSYQYFLSVSPADGHLYISNPEKHQVLRALSLDPVAEPHINCEPVVGSGERCIPGDETHCGDEGPARDAKLAHPKGQCQGCKWFGSTS
jgi:hypothetical protein